MNDIDDISNDIIKLTNKFVNNLAPKEVYSQEERIDLKKFVIEKISNYFKFYTDQKIIIGYENFKNIIESNINEYILDFNNDSENNPNNELKLKKVTAYLLTKNFLTKDRKNFERSLSLINERGFPITINSNELFPYISNAVNHYLEYKNFNNYRFIDLIDMISNKSRSINNELLKTTVRHIVESGLYVNVDKNVTVNYGDIQKLKEIFIDILDNSYEMKMSINDVFVLKNENKEVELKNFKKMINEYKINIKNNEKEPFEEIKLEEKVIENKKDNTLFINKKI